MALPPEVHKKVKLLEMKTKRLINSGFAGTYHSAFKGQGMTFADFREYVPGDDVRAISWPLTARTGKVYIKKYEEERELNLMLVVDISGSLDFGTRSYFKGEIAAHLAALLGFAAAKNNDNVGLMLVSDQVEHYVPPKKGRGHIQRLLTDLYYFKPRSRGTNLGVGLEYLRGTLKKRSIVFVISDFLDEGYSAPLRYLSKRHETVAVAITDPTEMEMPAVGLVDLYDPESGQVISVDTSSPVVRRSYKSNVQKMKSLRDSELKRAQVDRVDITAGEDFVDPLIAHFKRKAR